MFQLLNCYESLGTSFYLTRIFNQIFVQPCIVHNNRNVFVHMFLDTVLRQKMHNRWAAAGQKHQNDLCAKKRLRSAWASAQSDRSLRCSHGETLDPLSTQRRSWSDWVDAQADLSLCLAQMSFCLFCRAPAQDALLLLLLLLQLNTSIIAIATAAERKCRCVGFVVRRLRMHYNNNNYYYYYYHY